MKYYSIENTPLKWHTFYRYFAMPVGMISGIGAVFTHIAAMDNAFYLIDIAFCLIQTVCCSMAFVGFFRWKSYAWYAVMINLISGIVYVIAACLVNIAVDTDQIAYSLGSVAGASVASILIMIYYNKRKSLFFGTPASAERDIPAGLPSRVCPACGASAATEDNFCSKCGTAL